MKTLDGMTIAELRALETERFGQYEDQYDHGGHDAALRVGYFEIATEIRKRLDLGLVVHAASDRPEQTNGVHAHVGLAVAVAG